MEAYITLLALAFILCIQFDVVRSQPNFAKVAGEERVASRGQEIVSVASQGVRFTCISSVPSCQPQT
jgi:hypothetical protein